MGRKGVICEYYTYECVVHPVLIWLPPFPLRIRGAGMGVLVTTSCVFHVFSLVFVFVSIKIRRLSFCHIKQHNERIWRCHVCAYFGSTSNKSVKTFCKLFWLICNYHLCVFVNVLVCVEVLFSWIKVDTFI